LTDQFRYGIIISGEGFAVFPRKGAANMKELDTVRLNTDYEGVPAGTEGAIVLEYDGTAFEVEFFDNNGDTLCVLTIPADLLEPIERSCQKTDAVKTNDNYTFYEGYEGEPEIILSLAEQSLHIWDGYFDDIYGAPPLDGNGWSGFTRDYNQIEGIFSDDEAAEINPEEYLNDLMQYKDKSFDFKETALVFAAMTELFEKAIKLGANVIARMD